MTMLKKKDTLIIYGCGGHARSVADVGVSNGLTNITFVDKNARDQETIFNFDVIKTLSHETKKPSIVAIGDNKERADLFDHLKENHHELVPLIAHDAYISPFAKIESGVFVGHHAHIGPNAKIDENTIINTRCVVEHDCVVGKHCHISINANLAGKSKIGDFVMVGAGATVIDFVQVCSHVMIGAGAVVVDDITEPGTYVGVPARRIK